MPTKRYKASYPADIALKMPRLIVHLAIVMSVLAGSARGVAGDFLMDHVAKLSYDFRGMRLPEWSGGALVNFVSNQTAAPVLLSFDDQGRQLQAIPFTISGADMIDLDDIARSPDGTLAICGKAYDHSGRGSGFFGIISSDGGQAMTVRLYPYYPSRLTVAGDGTIWTAGLEAVNGKEASPGVNLQGGVIRHFDRTGKLLDAFIPRVSLSSHLMAEYGMLRSAKGRIGWYTGPVNGPGSVYYEFLSDGTIRKYLPISLNKSEYVTGLGLTDDGDTWVTISDTISHTWRFLSVTGPEQQWVARPLPNELQRADLYGAQGNSLVFHTSDRFFSFAGRSK